MEGSSGRISDDHSSKLYNTSNVSTSAATPLQSLVLGRPRSNKMMKETDENYRVVTTTLRQINRDEHNLADIERQLSFEQRTNHQAFESFSRVLQGHGHGEF